MPAATLKWIREQWAREMTEEEKRRYRGDNEARQHAFWKRLVCPSERLFFHACRHAAENDIAGELDCWLGETDTAAREIVHYHGNDIYRVFRAHLRLSRAASDADQLRVISRETKCEYPLLRDLMIELRPETSAEHPSLSQDQPLLSVDCEQEDGVVADLKLELVSDGSQALYPATQLAFARRDPGFRRAEAHARAWALDLWPRESDVRWSLARRDGQPLQALLSGDSAGGAFALGLAKLFVG